MRPSPECVILGTSIKDLTSKSSLLLFTLIHAREWLKIKHTISYYITVSYYLLFFLLYFCAIRSPRWFSKGQGFSNRNFPHRTRLSVESGTKCTPVTKPITKDKISSTKWQLWRQGGQGRGQYLRGGRSRLCPGQGRESPGRVQGRGWRGKWGGCHNMPAAGSQIPPKID